VDSLFYLPASCVIPSFFPYMSLWHTVSASGLYNLCLLLALPLSQTSTVSLRLSCFLQPPRAMNSYSSFNTYFILFVPPGRHLYYNAYPNAAPSMIYTSVHYQTEKWGGTGYLFCILST
jgi:hypothetical protein